MEPTFTKQDASLVSVNEFLKLQNESDQLYEFDRGQVLPIESMKNTERYMVSNLLRKWQKTKFYKEGAELIPETDCWLSDDQMRRPDLAYFTRIQIEASAKGENPVPAFVIEIISKNDEINQVELKTKEYLEAGVQLVWHVFPALTMVRVFKNIRTSHSFFEEDVLDAAPVLPTFKLEVGDIFKL